MNEPNEHPSFSAGRRWYIGLNVGLSLLAMVAIVAMVNYLAIRHPKRFSWNAQADFQLSPLSIQVVKAITNRVNVIVYYNPEQPLYGQVISLLKEYTLTNPRIVVEAVNYNSEPAKAGYVRTQYRLSDEIKDLIIFECNGRVETVTESALSELDMSKMLSGQSNEVKRKAFLGERLFTSKIITVTDPKPFTAFYLGGHGEHNPQNTVDDLGYGKFITMVAENNVTVKTLNLLLDSEVPATCDLLIIAGPAQDLLTTEVEKIEKYLNQGGRLLLLLNYLPHPKMNALMAKWGVRVGENVVYDDAYSQNNQSLVLQDYGSHPIVQPLSASQVPLIITPPHSIDKIQNNSQLGDAAQVTELVRTGPNGVARTTFRPGVPVPEASARDRRGAIPVMAAVEKGSIRGLRLERGSTRIVVTGDSMFLDNQMMTAYPRNREFGWQTVNWLLDRSQLLGNIGPRPFVEYSVTMTRTQVAAMRWLLLLVLPGSTLLLGLLVWFRRQH